MPVSLQHEHDDCYRLDISGRLRKIDLDIAQDALLSELDRASHPAVRLLVVLDGFEGWDDSGNWSDLTFYARHGNRIERMAIVAAEQWRDQALMFAGADLRKGPVEFFATDALENARAWLRE
jgi:hypothetical protein